MDESEDWFVLLLSRGDHVMLKGPALHLSLTNGHAEGQGGLSIGVWLEEGYYGKKVSVPRGHPLPLDRGSRLFLGYARFQGAHGCRLQPFLALWDKWEAKKTPMDSLPCCSSPEVPSQSTFFFPPFRIFLCLFVMLHPGFFSCKRRNRKELVNSYLSGTGSLSILLKWGVDELTKELKKVYQIIIILIFLKRTKKAVILHSTLVWGLAVLIATATRKCWNMSVSHVWAIVSKCWPLNWLYQNGPGKFIDTTYPCVQLLEVLMQ